MRPHTPRFREAIASSYTLATEVTVLSGGQEVGTVEPTDGSVTLDAQAQVRGRCTLTFNDPDLVVTGPDSILSPYGNEVQVKRGIRYGDGTSELISLGIFRIEDVASNDSDGSITTTITGLDRMQRLVDGAFEEPWEQDSGDNFADAILEVVQGAYPDVVTSFASTSVTTPLMGEEAGTDRAYVAIGLAEAIGFELYFDGDGILILRPIPQPGQGDPDAFVIEGGDVELESDPNLLGIDRNLTREGSFNRVIVTAEAAPTGETPRAVATDDDPDSPTYYFGEYGKKPEFYSNTYVTTQDQAQDVANGKLAQERGLFDSISFSALVDPTLEPGDVVQVRRERMGIDEQHVLDSVTIPLDAEGTLECETRAVRQVS